MEDGALEELLRAAEVQTGWGANRKFVLDGTGVFAKSIPLTQLEHAHPYCTRNLFELPTFYQYGVGSGGFGAFRELAAHVKTTEWVLSGAIEHFPLMYHHRVLPRLSPARRTDAEQLDQYVSYWNGSEAVREYVTARESAEHELVVFIERVEQNLGEWMVDHVEQFERVLPPLLDGCASCVNAAWCTSTPTRGTSSSTRAACS